MKQKLLLFAFTLLSTMLFSQSQNMAFEEWKNNTGTQNLFYKITPVTDFKTGDTYVAGATVTMNGTTDILLTKYYANGTFAWTQQYNGLANAIDFAAGIYVDNSQNVYVTGTVSNDTNNVTLTDLILIKYDNDGNQQWVATYDGGVGGLDIGKDIIVDDSNGNVYVTGGSHNSSYNSDILTICFDVSGVQQWVNTKDYNSLDDVGYKISMPRGPSELLITGAFTSSTNNYKLTNIEIDASNGNISSITTSTAVTTSSVDVVNDVVIDAQKNIYITGGYNVSGQGLNYYTMKMDSNLVIQWQQYYNGTSNLNDVAKGLDVDNSGNVYVTGYSTSSSQGRNFVTIKYNSAGSQQWAQTFNNSSNTDDEASDVVVDSLLNVYVTGSSISTLNQSDYYTIKYNSAGTKIWDIQTDAHHLNDKATNLVVDINNDIIITGQCETAPNTFEYTTVKYVQKDVITPTDFNGEQPSEPFWFYKNQGQIRDVNDSLVSGLQYYTDKTNPNIFINNNNMRFVFARIDSVASTNDTIHCISMGYNGANEYAKTYSLEKKDFYISYFNGIDRDFTGISANAKLITPNIYPNIDLMYSSNQNGIKYYYIVKPGGDMRNIQIEFTGASSYSLNTTTNNLTINTSIGNITFDRPTAYQLSSSNSTIAVTSFTPDWTTNGASNKYKFNNGSYTSSLTLVIEVDCGNAVSSPSAVGNLMWNTYQGGNWDDYNADLKLDRYGNIYTMAFTNSSNYYTNNTFQTIAPSTSNEGTMIIKYNMYGKRKNQVYIGSNSNTGGAAIVIVNDSNVVLVGRSSGTNLSGPTSGTNPSGAYTSTVGPSFLMKFSITLNSILWSTKYPGELYDADAKNNGDIYVVGMAHKTVALITNQAGATNIPASALTTLGSSSIVSKFNKNGATLWSSYFGVSPLGQFWNTPMRIKIDTTREEFYIVGKPNGITDWRGYNVYGTFYQPTQNSSSDAYIKKFSRQDSMIVSTFYGGNKGDELSEAVILPNGDVCFVGATLSTDTANITYNPHDGSYFSKKYDNSYTKGWISKFSANFTRKWATLYGDSMRTTTFRAVTSDNIYNATLIGGYTQGMPNLSYSGSYNKASDASGDAAFLSFNEGNKVTWATSMGVNNLYENGIYALQFNTKNNNLDFGGSSDGNSNYPWVQYTGSYWQDFNYAPGHDECNVGRFNVDLNILVGVKELSNNIVNSDILLFPNPTNSILNLHFKKGLVGSVKISMYNALGQIIETSEYKTILDNTTINFNTSSLTEGIYFINISTENSTKTLKFVTFK